MIPKLFHSRAERLLFFSVCPPDFPLTGRIWQRFIRFVLMYAYFWHFHCMHFSV